MTLNKTLPLDVIGIHPSVPWPKISVQATPPPKALSRRMPACAARSSPSRPAWLPGWMLPGRSTRRSTRRWISNPGVEEGVRVEDRQVLALVSGRTRSLLTAERTALNFLGRMSGIATLTNQFVQAVAGTRAVILDTRKTAPGLRARGQTGSGVAAAGRTTASACMT